MSTNFFTKLYSASYGHRDKGSDSFKLRNIVLTKYIHAPGATVSSSCKLKVSKRKTSHRNDLYDITHEHTKTEHATTECCGKGSNKPAQDSSVKVETVHIQMLRIRDLQRSTMSAYAHGCYEQVLCSQVRLSYMYLQIDRVTKR